MVGGGLIAILETLNMDAGAVVVVVAVPIFPADTSLAAKGMSRAVSATLSPKGMSDIDTSLGQKTSN